MVIEAKDFLSYVFLLYSGLVCLCLFLYMSVALFDAGEFFEKIIMISKILFFAAFAWGVVLMLFYAHHVMMCYYEAIFT